MDWISIHSSAFKGDDWYMSTSSQRGVWLALHHYCARWDHPGFIKDCRDWEDRNWLQLVNVRRYEVMRKSPLWFWYGDELHLMYFPTAEMILKERKRLRADLASGYSSTKRDLEERDGRGCKICKTKAGRLVIDHRVPISRGGGNELRNLQLLCARCNGAKSDGLPKPIAESFT